MTETAQTPNPMPITPTGLSVKWNATEQRAELKWGNSGAMITTEYEVEIERGNPDGTASTSKVYPNRGFYHDTGLTVGARYYYRIRFTAKDTSKYRDGGWSSPLSLVPSAPPEFHVKPEKLRAEWNPERGVVMLTWSSIGENSRNRETYSVEIERLNEDGTVTSSNLTYNGHFWHDSSAPPGRLRYRIRYVPKDQSDGEPTAWTPVTTVSVAEVTLRRFPIRALRCTPKIVRTATERASVGDVAVTWIPNATDEHPHSVEIRRVNPDGTETVQSVDAQLARGLWVDSGATEMGKSYGYQVRFVPEDADTFAPTPWTAVSYITITAARQPFVSSFFATFNPRTAAVRTQWSQKFSAADFSVEIQRRNPDGTTSSQIIESPAGFWEDSGIELEKTYQYRARTVSTETGGVGDFGQWHTVTTSKAQAITVSDVGLEYDPAHATVIVSWTARGSIKPDEYAIEVERTNPNGTTDVQSINEPDGEFIDTGITTGNRYYYRVRAVPLPEQYSATAWSIPKPIDCKAQRLPVPVISGQWSERDRCVILTIRVSTEDVRASDYTTRIHRTDEHGRVETFDVSDGSTVVHRDFDVEPGKRYVYTGITVSDNENLWLDSYSGRSRAVACVLTKPEKPTGFKAVWNEQQQRMTFVWDGMREPGDVASWEMQRDVYDRNGYWRGWEDFKTVSTEDLSTLYDSGCEIGYGYRYRLRGIGVNEMVGDWSAVTERVWAVKQPNAVKNLQYNPDTGFISWENDPENGVYTSVDVQFRWWKDPAMPGSGTLLSGGVTQQSGTETSYYIGKPGDGTKSGRVWRADVTPTVSGAKASTTSVVFFGRPEIILPDEVNVAWTTDGATVGWKQSEYRDIMGEGTVFKLFGQQIDIEITYGEEDDWFPVAYGLPVTQRAPLKLERGVNHSLRMRSVVVDGNGDRVLSGPWTQGQPVDQSKAPFVAKAAAERAFVDEVVIEISTASAMRMGIRDVEVNWRVDGKVINWDDGAHISTANPPSTLNPPSRWGSLTVDGGNARLSWFPSETDVPVGTAVTAEMHVVMEDGRGVWQITATTTRRTRPEAPQLVWDPETMRATMTSDFIPAYIKITNTRTGRSAMASNQGSGGPDGRLTTSDAEVKPSISYWDFGKTGIDLGFGDWTIEAWSTFWGIDGEVATVEWANNVPEVTTEAMFKHFNLDRSSGYAHFDIEFPVGDATHFKVLRYSDRIEDAVAVVREFSVDGAGAFNPSAEVLRGLVDRTVPLERDVYYVIRGYNQHGRFKDSLPIGPVRVWSDYTTGIFLDTWEGTAEGEQLVLRGNPTFDVATNQARALHHFGNRKGATAFYGPSQPLTINVSGTIREDVGLGSPESEWVRLAATGSVWQYRDINGRVYPVSIGSVSISQDNWATKTVSLQLDVLDGEQA